MEYRLKLLERLNIFHFMWVFWNLIIRILTLQGCNLSEHYLIMKTSQLWGSTYTKTWEKWGIVITNGHNFWLIGMIHLKVKQSRKKWDFMVVWEYGAIIFKDQVNEDTNST